MSAETITTPALPELKRVPKWAEKVGEPEWVESEGRWLRDLEWRRDAPDGGSVNMIAVHWTTPSGQVTVDALSIEVEWDLIDTAEQARQAAAWLLDAADALTGPPFADLAARAPEPLGAQRRVAANVHRWLVSQPTGQLELAIAAGYGQDELSSFMTGRRLMDLTDVDRLAAAMRMSPFDLLSDIRED